MPDPFEKPDRLERAAEIFKGFGNPVRLRIIIALREGGLRVSDLVRETGCPQPIVSQQLKILRSAGIVRKTREGPSHLYRLADPGFAEILSCVRKGMEP